MKAKLDEAKALEDNVTGADAPLELKIGLALAGTKKTFEELVSEWDKNRDGVIQRIELRQVVRNSLKITADNKAVDTLFDKLDKDSLRVLSPQDALGNKSRWIGLEVFLNPRTAAIQSWCSSAA